MVLKPLLKIAAKIAAGCWMILAVLGTLLLWVSATQIISCFGPAGGSYTALGYLEYARIGNGEIVMNYQNLLFNFLITAILWGVLAAFIVVLKDSPQPKKEQVL